VNSCVRKLGFTKAAIEAENLFERGTLLQISSKITKVDSSGKIQENQGPISDIIGHSARDKLDWPLKSRYPPPQCLELINFASKLAPVLKSNGVHAGRGAVHAQSGWICGQSTIPFLPFCLLSNPH
jgi:hypothetical protein